MCHVAERVMNDEGEGAAGRDGVGAGRVKRDDLQAPYARSLRLDDVRNFWGESRGELWRRAVQTVETSDHWATIWQDSFHSRAGVLTTNAARLVAMHRSCIFQTNNSGPHHPDRMHAVAAAVLACGEPLFYMHMFATAIASMGSEAQVREWLPKAFNFEIIGTYAQTELGHRSNVRGLETTATYDAETDTVAVNMPTLTATKWWPGALGLLATHAVLHAHLLVGGKDLGYHTIMVQLRDEHHQPLPGVEVGDIGPKMGGTTMDAGYLRLSNVRVPRTNILAKHFNFEEAIAAEQLRQSNTMALRMFWCNGFCTRIRVAADRMSMALQIAGRFMATRRQGHAGDDTSTESRVFDYVVQRHRLVPLTATCVALHLYSIHLLSHSHIDELLFAAALRCDAVASVVCRRGIEEARRACGGFGYTMASGVALLLTEQMCSAAAAPQAEDDMHFSPLCKSNARWTKTDDFHTLGLDEMQELLKHSVRGLTPASQAAVEAEMFAVFCCAVDRRRGTPLGSHLEDMCRLYGWLLLQQCPHPPHAAMQAIDAEVRRLVGVCSGVALLWTEGFGWSERMLRSLTAPAHGDASRMHRELLDWAARSPLNDEQFKQRLYSDVLRDVLLPGSKL